MIRTKDVVTLGVLLWLMLRDRPHSEVNLTVTEPGFPPNINTPNTTDYRTCYYSNGQGILLPVNEPCPNMPEWGGGAIYQEPYVSQMAGYENDCGCGCGGNGGCA
jgi:hypothetical protein